MCCGEKDGRQMVDKQGTHTAAAGGDPTSAKPCCAGELYAVTHLPSTIIIYLV